LEEAVAARHTGEPNAVHLIFPVVAWADSYCSTTAKMRLREGDFLSSELVADNVLRNSEAPSLRRELQPPSKGSFGLLCILYLVHCSYFSCLTFLVFALYPL
jgi:hypothetical protein